MQSFKSIELNQKINIPFLTDFLLRYDSKIPAMKGQTCTFIVF